MEQNQNPRDEAYQNLREAKSKKRTSYAKTIGYSAVPVLALGGTALVAGLGASCFENHDVRTAVSMGFGLALGGIAGYTGMVADYIEKFRDLVDDVKFASQRVRGCRTRVKTLETIE
jgi:hypothetical protein